MLKPIKLEGKVCAFTIIELMLALIISSIIVTMVYYTFLFFKKQMNGFIKKSEIEHNFYIFRRRLNEDLTMATVVKDSGAAILKIHGAPDKEEIFYYFKDSFAVRANHLTIDTFWIPMKMNELSYVSDSVRLITDFKILSSIGDHVIISSYLKDYSAQELMNEEKYYNAQQY